MDDKNVFIRFIHANGMRPIIALVTIAGAIYVTAKSPTICVINEGNEGSGGAIIRENPACSRYFEMAALVLGGLLGLAVPSNGKVEEKQEDKLGEAKPQKDTGLSGQPEQVVQLAEVDQPIGSSQYGQVVKDS